MFGGIGFRSNESHSRALAGVKLALPNRVALGLQWEGHAAHPFATYAFEKTIVGIYLIGGRSPGYLVGMRF